MYLRNSLSAPHWSMYMTVCTGGVVLRYRASRRMHKTINSILMKAVGTNPGAFNYYSVVVRPTSHATNVKLQQNGFI